MQILVKIYSKTLILNKQINMFCLPLQINAKTNKIN